MSEDHKKGSKGKKKSGSDLAGEVKPRGRKSKTSMAKSPAELEPLTGGPEAGPLGQQSRVGIDRPCDLEWGFRFQGIAEGATGRCRRIHD